MSKLRKDRVTLTVLAAMLTGSGVYELFPKGNEEYEVVEPVTVENKDNPLYEEMPEIENIQPNLEQTPSPEEIRENEVNTFWRSLESNGEFQTWCRLLGYSMEDAYQIIDYNFSAWKDQPTLQQAKNILLECSGLRNRAGDEVYQYLLTNSIGQAILNYSLTYGVDPLLTYSLCKQESDLDHYNHIPGENGYDGAAYGVSQQENTTLGETYSAYNIATGQVDNVVATVDNLTNLNTNVQIATMKLSGYLNQYHGNIALALISYNYGRARGLDVAEAAANDLGTDIDTLSRTPSASATSLILSHAKNLSENPGDYFNTSRSGSYGDGEYVKNVCRRSPTVYLYGLQDTNNQLITLLNTSNPDNPEYIITSIDDFKQTNSNVLNEGQTLVKE